MDEFAADPLRGAGVGKVHARDPTLAERRAGNALVESRLRCADVAEHRPVEHRARIYRTLTI